MKTNLTLHQFMSELARQNAAKRDFLVPAPMLELSTSPAGVCSLAFRPGDGLDDVILGVSDIARPQLAERIDMPVSYFDKIRFEHPGLLDTSVRTLLRAQKEESHLVRALDGQCRALLSDTYRRVDNFDLATMVFNALSKIDGLEYASLDITAKKMYIKVNCHKTTVELKRGDVIRSGLCFQNSEVGHGRMRCDPFVERLVCVNGMVVEELGMFQTHTGRKHKALTVNTALECDMFKDDTVAAIDNALLLKVRDFAEYAVSLAMLEKVADRLRRTMKLEIIGQPVQVVEELARRHRLTEEEGMGVLQSLLRQADMNAFGLVNAVTDYSKQVPDYDRATELESLGGVLTFMPEKDWSPILKPAGQDGAKRRIRGRSASGINVAALAELG